MRTSILIARLIGPVLSVIGIGVLANGDVYRQMFGQLVHGYPFIYFSGILLLVAGLAILNVHHDWTADWRSVITAVGWILTGVGMFRLIAPQFPSFRRADRWLRTAASSSARASCCSRLAASSLSKVTWRKCRAEIGDTVMNIHDPKVTLPKVTTGALPASRKVYVSPEAAPDLRVPIREIDLDPSSGEAALPVYDTTGPYTDPDVTIDVEKGLARTRIEWVKERGGVEEYEGRPDPAGRQRQCQRQASGAEFPQYAEAVAGGSSIPPRFAGRAASEASRAG